MAIDIIGVMPSDDRERLARAAFRLKHDLGKVLRWGAPGRREAGAEELRSRLQRDLLATRTGPAGRESAIEVFDAWMAEDGSLFLSPSAGASRLARIASAVDVLRDRLPLLSALDYGELVLLDETALVLQDEIRAFWRETVSEAPARSPA